jgi:hypothetical protein
MVVEDTRSGLTPGTIPYIVPCKYSRLRPSLLALSHVMPDLRWLMKINRRSANAVQD